MQQIWPRNREMQGLQEPHGKQGPTGTGIAIEYQISKQYRPNIRPTTLNSGFHFLFQDHYIAPYYLVLPYITLYITI